MRTITGDKFKRFVEEDPAWAAKLTEPVEITGWCLMTGSRITHLSELLHFRPNIPNLGETAISFESCLHLKKAEGNFGSRVIFNNSKIEEIGKLIVHSDGNGESADFVDCQNLKIARGIFHGTVVFSHSGIEKIDPENLIVTRPGLDGIAAKFSYCKNLKVAEGDFPGSAHFYHSGISKIGKLSSKPNKNEFSLDIMACPDLKECPEWLLRNGVEMDDSLRQKTVFQKMARDKMRNMKKTGPILEI